MSRVAVLEPLPVFALVVDRRGKIAWVNEFNASANDAEPSELIGKDPAEVWPESRRDARYDAMVRRTGRPVSHFSYGRTRMGRRVFLDVTRAPLPGGRILAVGVEKTGDVKYGATRVRWDPRPKSARLDAAAAGLLSGRAPSKAMIALAEALTARGSGSARKPPSRD